MWAKFVLLMVVLWIFTLPVAAQLPIPTVPAELTDRLSDATNQTNQLPSDITRPDGQSVIPSSSPAQLFSYIKWLFSYNTAQELLGRRLAPLGVQLFVMLNIGILLSSVFLMVNLVTITIRFVIWILNLIWKVLQLIPLI